MATYLFNLELGDFETVGGTVAGIPLHVVTTRGKARQGTYAVQVASSSCCPSTTTTLASATRCPSWTSSPCPKATAEPWKTGAPSPTTRVSCCSIRPRLRRRTESASFVDVAHEMAHQWFGDSGHHDVVGTTCGSANEAFAQWMALAAQAHFNPSR